MFVEKPSADAAKMLIRKGALWNTMVLVATCNTLLQVIKRAAPGLYRSFEPIHDAIGTPDEQQVTERVYQMLPSFNLSKGVLEVLRFEHRRALLVLPVSGCYLERLGNGRAPVEHPKRLGRIGVRSIGKPTSRQQGSWRWLEQSYW